MLKQSSLTAMEIVVSLKAGVVIMEGIVEESNISSNTATSNLVVVSLIHLKWKYNNFTIRDCNNEIMWTILLLCYN